MQLIEIVRQYPEVLAQFLDISGVTVVMILDEDYRITSCYGNLTHEINLPRNPVGMDLSSLLCPFEEDSLSLALSDFSSGVVPQIFQLCNTKDMYRCYSYKIDSGYLVLADNIGSSENSVLQSMAHLNNELSVMSRELSKKNRELQQANATITELSRTDQLTGLANRSYFFERLGETLSLTQRHNLELAVLIADIDHFKRVNDTYGHGVGDEVLRVFGTIIAADCRYEDFPGRYGGEEFVVMLPETSVSGTQSLYYRVRDNIIKQNMLTSPDVVTFSAGVAGYEHGDTQESLLKKADDALYEAKNNGRDQCVVYSP